MSASASAPARAPKPVFSGAAEPLGQVAVKDVPAWLTSNLKANGGALGFYNRITQGYRARYFQGKGSAMPLIHAFIFCGVLGYALEVEHLRHSQGQAKHH